LVSEREIESILQTYSMSEILELNDITEEEALYFLVSHKFVILPDPLPVDVEE